LIGTPTEHSAISANADTVVVSSGNVERSDQQGGNVALARAVGSPADNLAALQDRKAVGRSGGNLDRWLRK
jgi:hypothetical protein